MPKSLSLQDLPKPIYQGKIRSLYPVDEKRILMYTSDKVSAFDVIFSEKILDKGKILNQISCLWFQALEREKFYEKYNFQSQIISSHRKDFPEPYSFCPELENRSCLIKKTKRISYECIVRGYLTGSAWKDYKREGKVCGHKLKKNLVLGAKLEPAIFTPSTKSDLDFHDINVSWEIMCQDIGKEQSQRLKDISLAIYKWSSLKMEKIGILLVDTKFEFGLDEQDRIVLIDEILTPDSSRYWRIEDYQKGNVASGFDKQRIRDYLEDIHWNKKPPAPPLPESLLEETFQLYSDLEDLIKKALV